MSRYIDVDVLLEELEEELAYDTPMYTEEQNKYFTMGLRCAYRDVKKQPTADVVEVRHGEWIDKPTGAYSRMQSWCSACGKHSGIGGIESNRHKPYCPNCDAKIDGERSENGK
jgi:hypothetical protein